MSGFKTIFRLGELCSHRIIKAELMQQKKPHVTTHTLIFLEHWNNSIFSIIIIIIIIYLFIYIKYLQLYPSLSNSPKPPFFAQYVKFQLGTTTEHWNKLNFF